MANYKTCTHIKITGHRCGSPALRGERFCYFHQHVHRGVRRRSTSRMHPIALFESEEALQVSLMEVVNALLYDGLDLKRATLILRALHIAVKNARRVRLDIREDEMITEVPQETPEAEPPLFHASDMELPISAAAVPDEDPVAAQGNRIHRAYNRALRTEEILRKEDEAHAQARGAADANVRDKRDVPAPSQPQAPTPPPPPATHARTAVPACQRPDSPIAPSEPQKDVRKPSATVKTPQQKLKPAAQAAVGKAR